MNKERDLYLDENKLEKFYAGVDKAIGELIELYGREYGEEVLLDLHKSIEKWFYVRKY